MSNIVVRRAQKITSDDLTLIVLQRSITLYLLVVSMRSSHGGRDEIPAVHLLRDELTCGDLGTVLAAVW